MKKRGVKKIGFAEALGASSNLSYNGKILKARSFFKKLDKKKIDLSQLKNIALLLRVSENYLLFGEEEKKENGIHLEHDKAKYKSDTPEISEKKAAILERISKEKNPEVIEVLTEALKAV